MKWVRKLLSVVLVALVALAVIAFVGFQWLFMPGRPAINGAFDAPGLEKKVIVVRDTYGVPHVFADTESDAYYALGWLHAQERLWEMDLLRRTAEGRLAELFGDAPMNSFSAPTRSILEQDMFYRTLGFSSMMEGKLDGIPPESRKILDAYLAGINAWVAANHGNLQPEFRILRYRPEPWTVRDIAAMGRLVSWGLSANMRSELLRYEAITRLGVADGWRLVDRHRDPGPYIIPPRVKRYEPRGKKIPVNPWYLPPEMVKASYFDAGVSPKSAWTMPPSSPFRLDASNNWVVAGTRTASGKPILCNDPHLYHTVPSLFYEAHLSTRDGLDVIGVSFPGMPFIVLGHNRFVAWGATTTGTDVQDLFVEKTDAAHPGRYLYKGEWLPFKVRTEKFIVRGRKKPVVLTVRTTLHGVVMNNVLPYVSKDAPLMALRWIATDGGPTDLTTFLQVPRARSVKDLRAAIAQFVSPIQSWVLADTQGHIGFFPGGAVPIRKKGDGTVPVPGWTGEYDWAGTIPVDELPQLFDPSDGYIVTANNKVVPEEDYPYPYSYDYITYRAERIEELLKSKPKWTGKAMRAVQMDTFLVQGRRLAPLYIAACRAKCYLKDPLTKKALDILEKWRYTTGPDDVGASIFLNAYEKTMESMYARFPKDFYLRVVNQWSFDSRFDNALEDPGYPFFDDPRTPRVESRDDILARAFITAVRDLKDRLGPDPAQWRWGRLHTAHFKHPLGVVPVLGYFLNPKPFEATGARNTVFNSDYGHGGSFEPDDGPVFRQIIDMAHVEDAVMVIDSGQSGHPHARHYIDQQPMWRAGRYVPMWMDRAVIEKHKEGTMELRPKHGN
jgi:penicillin G amidase